MGSRLLKDMTIKEQLEYQIQLSINGYDMVINKYDLELDAKKITMAQHYDLCKKANADITQDIL
ncbi:hypothetical protein FACS1894166_09620 [Bacilli bacterium]|nr:hypothetical protein FACS1894166_09620 [Bacilli bacterium]